MILHRTIEFRLGFNWRSRWIY